MLVSFLIASASAGLTITNRCGIDGAVPHSFMVTLKSPLHSSNRRSTSTSASEDKLSFLHAWVQQYNPVGGGSGGGEGDTGSLGGGEGDAGGGDSDGGGGGGPKNFSKADDQKLPTRS